MLRHIEGKGASLGRCMAPSPIPVRPVCQSASWGGGSGQGSIPRAFAPSSRLPLPLAPQGVLL